MTTFKKTQRRKRQSPPPQTQLDQYIAAIDVAEALRVCTSTVYKLVRTGQLSSIRVMGSIRIRLQDVETFLAQHSIGPQASGFEGRRQGD